MLWEGAGEGSCSPVLRLKNIKLGERSRFCRLSQGQNCSTAVCEQPRAVGIPCITLHQAQSSNNSLTARCWEKCLPGMNQLGYCRQNAGTDPAPEWESKALQNRCRHQNPQLTSHGRVQNLIISPLRGKGRGQGLLCNTYS